MYLFIRLRGKNTIIRSEKIQPGVTINYDDEGKIISIEILSAVAVTIDREVEEDETPNR